MIIMNVQHSLTTCRFLARDLFHQSANKPSMHAPIPCCPDGLCDVYWHRSMAKSKWCGDTHKWAVWSYVMAGRRRSPYIVIFHHDTNHKNIFPWIKELMWRTTSLVRVCEPVKDHSSQLNLSAYTQATKTTKAIDHVFSSISHHINWHFMACNHNRSKQFEVSTDLHFLPGGKVWHKKHECHTTHGSKPTKH